MSFIKTYQQRIFYIVLAVILLILLMFAHRAAVNIDEILHYNYAHQVIDCFSSGGKDTTCMHTPVTNLKYYGQSVDNLSALINRTFNIQDEYLTRHYIGAVITWLLLLFTGLLAKEITGNYMAGILAVLLFVISPRPMGQAFGNLKDIPFALGYTAGILGLIRIFKKMPYPAWKDILTLAIAVAFTNSVRIGGLIFYPYLGLFFLIWLYQNRKSESDNIHSFLWWKNIAIKGLVILLIGYFAGILFWPYGLDNPLVHPIESLRVMEHYKVSIRQIFMGEMVWSTHLPWYYLPLWMLISIPEIVWIGIGGFIVWLFYNEKRPSFAFGILMFSFLFPLFYVLLVDANLYSGWRQMYFIYSPMIIMSAIGLNNIYKWISNNTARFIMAATAVILGLFPVIHTIKTFPADYIYFNQFAGGTKKVWSNYEYDYYWHGMKEAAGWLQENEDLPEETVIASNLDMPFYFPDNKNVKLRYVHFYDRNAVEWDYAILGNNYVHPSQLKLETWKPENAIKTFYHKDNPYIVILKHQNRDAVKGISLYKQKKPDEAIPLLQSAIESDSTDVRAMASLAACFLSCKEWEKLETLLEKGFRIYPDYEPLLHLEAQMEFDKENYKKSKNLCLKLLKLNPKYRKVVALLANCYDELGEHDLADKYREKLRTK
jgi:tetratricopeptide (TPR) repeat protein